MLVPLSLFLLGSRVLRNANQQIVEFVLNARRIRNFQFTREGTRIEGL
jgi:hypothetical protein